MGTRRIFITGHHGYIGSVMAPYFQSRDYDVVGCDTEYFDRECAFLPDPTPIKTLRKDLRDLTAQDLAGCFAVIHLAAICNDPLGNLNPEWTYDINHRGTAHLARLAKAAGAARFLFSSSCSMHGASAEAKVTEATPVHPLTPYGESKIRAEQDLIALADDRFCPSFLRNGTVYGVAPRHRLDIVLNNLVGWAATTGTVRIMTDGSPWRPVIHVEDVCRAFQAVLEAPREVVWKEAFHVGMDAQNFRIRDLAEIVRQVVPGCAVEYLNAADADQRTYIADFRKIAERIPAFRPKWSAMDGARQLYAAYREQHLAAEEMQGRRFIRLGRINQLIADGRLDETLRWRMT